MAATLGNGNIVFGNGTIQSTAALPLAGGTLTGELSGTSIVTSGAITVGRVLVVRAENGGIKTGDYPVGRYWNFGIGGTTGSAASAFTIYNSDGNNGVYLPWGGTAWSGSSDERLKDITGTYTDPFTDVKKIRPIKFTWKSDETKTPCVGVIAQSVLEAVPEAVNLHKINDADPTDYYGVAYTELIPLVIASVQKLIDELDASKKENEVLRARLDLIESRILALESK